VADENDDLTGEDWGEIHKRAWLDADFKELLETDPTKAIKEVYAQSVGKRFDKILFVRPKPDIAEEFLPYVNPFPPSCC
jgi:hypothetical protein